MKHLLTVLSALVCVSVVVPSSASAALSREKVFAADSKKTKFYLKDGLVTGGDRAITETTVRDIRRASNAGFERIVIDLEGTRNGEAAALKRAPYFQVAVSPEEKRLVVTLWGNPKLAFQAQKVVTAFKKSKVVERVELLPRVEDDIWTFVVALRDPTPVEVFELTDPARIILDVKSQ